MLKNKLFLLALLVPGLAFAQDLPGIQNEALATKNNTAGSAGKLAIDKKGRLMISPLSGSGFATYAEDAPHVSGDIGQFSLAVRNSAGSSLTNTDGDYSPFGVDQFGSIYGDISYDHQASTTLGILHAEDVAAASADAGVAALYITQDPLVVDQSTTGDYAVPKVDRSGRTITTPAPASETWQACGTATAVTSDVAIKAAVASNRIYVTAITCKNTSATVASSLDFKDATTVIAVGGIAQMAAASAGSFVANFSPPLRGTSNTAFNFATNISVSSVTCCGSGYIATN